MFRITQKQENKFSQVQRENFAKKVFDQLLTEGLVQPKNEVEELKSIMETIAIAKDKNIVDEKNVYRFIRFERVMSLNKFSTQNTWVLDTLNKLSVSSSDRLNILEHELNLELSKEKNN